MIHPNKHLAGWQGVLQADAYSGYNDLYLDNRSPGPARSALCWSHARRKFFELADIAAAHSDTSDQVFRRHMISHSGVSDHPEMTPSGAVW